MGNVLRIAAVVLLSVALMAGIGVGGFFAGQGTRQSDAQVAAKLESQKDAARRHERQAVRTTVKRALADQREDFRVEKARAIRKNKKFAAQKGRQEGYASGSAAGFSSGHTTGKEEGRVEGEAEGYAEGSFEGYLYGYGDAYEECYYDEFSC